MKNKQYVMYSDKKYKSGTKVYAQFVEYDGKPHEVCTLLKRRTVHVNGQESYSYKEFLVQSKESDKKDWVSGYFVRKVRRTELAKRKI